MSHHSSRHKPINTQAESALAQGENAHAQGDFAQALNCYRLAVMHDPEDPAMVRGLAKGLLANGVVGASAAAALAAVDQAPLNTDGLLLLAKIAQRVKAVPEGVTIPAVASVRALLAVLASEKIDHQDFVILCLSTLRATPPLAGVLQKLKEKGPEETVTWLLTQAGRKALEDPLLQTYLARTINLDSELEALLIVLRRRILLERLWRSGEIPPAMLAALARQCLNNEHIFLALDEEISAEQGLADEIEDRIRTRRKLGPELLALTCYRPPWRLAGFTTLAKSPQITEPHTRRLIAELASGQAEEIRLRKTIPMLTAINDGVSTAVAQQYEENPYPRWLSLTPPEPGIMVPVSMTDRDISVLIAGCGTGQQAVMAAIGYGSRAKVLAIDLSRSSLAYAQRKSRDLRLDDLRYAQADILGLGDMEERFDVIECSGVLHHMAEPMAGWKVLTKILAPGGIMKVALYSQRARRLVSAARDAITRRGLGNTDEDIRRFRWDLMSGHRDNVGLSAIAADFYSLSNARDLLFHVQEHLFTPLGIKDCLAELGLEFLGFDNVPKGIVPTHEERDLNAWEAAEIRNPDIFRCMMKFTCKSAK